MSKEKPRSYTLEQFRAQLESEAVKRCEQQYTQRRAANAAGSGEGSGGS